MTNVVAQYGYVGIFVVVGLESFGVPLPGETTLIAAAIYAGATHQLNIVGIILAAIAGAILGDNIGYLIGHQGGYRLLVRYGRYIRFNESRIKLARYLFMRFGGQVVFFGRFVAVLRAYAAFLAGTSRMRWRTFLLFNAAGGIVWASIYGTAAYFLGAGIQRISGPLGIAFAIAGALGIVAGAIFVRREEGRLTVEAEKALPGPLRD